MYNAREAFRARLAQSVERWTFNPTAVGSSPTSGAPFFLLATLPAGSRTFLFCAIDRSHESLLISLDPGTFYDYF